MSSMARITTASTPGSPTHCGVMSFGVLRDGYQGESSSRYASRSPAKPVVASRTPQIATKQARQASAPDAAIARSPKAARKLRHGDEAFANMVANVAKCQVRCDVRNQVLIQVLFIMSSPLPRRDRI